MPDLHSAKLIAVIALVTIALRFLPFVIFSGKRQTPAYISYLGKVLPFSIMGMLVIYCYKTIDLTSSTHGIPEILAGLVVAGLQFWKKNMFVSICAGTALYMVLIRVM